MTRTDAAKMLAVLSAAYSHTVEEHEAEVWFNTALEHVSAAIGEQTVQRLIRDDRFWPSPARFNETRRAIERGQVEPVKALPWGPRNDTDRQNARKAIAAIREVVANTTPPYRRSLGTTHTSRTHEKSEEGE